MLLATRRFHIVKSFRTYSIKSGFNLKNLLNNIGMANAGDKKYDGCTMGEESIMSKKAHGTSEKPVMDNLRWDCDFETADRICNFNRHYAEHSGYFVKKKKFLQELDTEGSNVKFYDAVTGELLFQLENRDPKEFLVESKAHGWPSFRDDDVNWEFCRCLPNGEMVSTTGTHLGHNLPDRKGNRFCINLVSVAGNPKL